MFFNLDLGIGFHFTSSRRLKRSIGNAVASGLAATHFLFFSSMMLFTACARCRIMDLEIVTDLRECITLPDVGHMDMAVPFPGALCHDFIHRQYLLPVANCEDGDPLFFQSVDYSVIIVY